MIKRNASSLIKRLLHFSSTGLVGKEQIHISWPRVIHLVPTRYYVVVTSYISFTKCHQRLRTSVLPAFTAVTVSFCLDNVCLVSSYFLI